MKPTKILYVDDEAIALKYFERLVGPLAPVLTAISVEEGRAMLGAHHAEIAVLVCDQRMPGERGNELLRHARQHYPNIVRMLTTAYSELGEAIDAINTGEIYRYIAKPWELESLRTDLKNALELADLRNERDGLVRDKLMAQQSRLLGNRLGSLLMVSAAVHEPAHEAAVFSLARAALVVGGVEPAVDWNRWDHADLLQAEARRGAGIASHLRHWMQQWGARSDDAQALSVLAQATGGEVRGSAVHLPAATGLTALLAAPAGEAVSAPACAWLAWLLWCGTAAQVEAEPGGWRVTLAERVTPTQDWLADAIERLGHTR
jgi:two-component system, probable response regulator PhcQ